MLEAAGFKGRATPNAAWTEPTAIAAVQAYHERTGRVPAIADGGPKNGLPAQKVMERLFGSWSAGIKAAGLVPRKRGERDARNARDGRRHGVVGNWTRESISYELRTFYEREGRPPSSMDATRNLDGRLPSIGTVKRHFGTWNTALEAAEIPTTGQGAVVADGLLAPIADRSPRARAFEAAAVALGLRVEPGTFERLYRMALAADTINRADAEDCVQEAWLVLAEKAVARKINNDNSAIGFMAKAACWEARKIASDRRRTHPLSLDGIMAARARGEATHREPTHHTDIDDQVDARMRLAALLERCQPGDDVMHVVADMEREALNLYQPVAQRREADVLDGLPDGKWLRKLRAAHAAGHVPCVCWECVRAAGITPPPELAQRFPDCHGERPGVLTRKREEEPSPVMASIFDALDIGDTRELATA